TKTWPSSAPPAMARNDVAAASTAWSCSMVAPPAPAWTTTPSAPMVSDRATVALASSTDRFRKPALGEAMLTMYGACRTRGPKPSSRHRRPNSPATSAFTDGGAHALGFDPQIWAASAPQALADSMAPIRPPRVGTWARIHTDGYEGWDTYRLTLSPCSAVVSSAGLWR